jgi:hypothetical protein
MLKDIYIQRFSQRFLSFLSFLCTILTLGWMYKYSAYGIDFTDESYYLVWIANPFIYKFSVTQFGFVYHLLYDLLDGNIVHLRQANVLITFLLAWVFVRSFLVAQVPFSRNDPISLNAASLGLASCALVVFNSWLLTPNYNSLTLQAFLIVGLGLMQLEKLMNLPSILGSLAVALGVWLAFLAKPSAAFALSFILLVYLIVSHKLSRWFLFFSASIVSFLILISALLIDGSIVAFTDRLFLGYEFGSQLGGGHRLNHILRVDYFLPSWQLIGYAFALFLFTSVAMSSFWDQSGHRRIPASNWINFLFFILIASLLTTRFDLFVDVGRFQGLVFFGIVFAAVFSGLQFVKRFELAPTSQSQLATAGLLLLMPHAYAFGTNGNYWEIGSSAAIFWLLAGFTFMQPLAHHRKAWSISMPIVLAAQALTIVILQTASLHPYRQDQALHRNTTYVEFGTQKSSLVLSAPFATYISSAKRIALDSGLQPNTPIIDLTGQSPGILFVLGAESIGQAWMIGGYSGSLKLAKLTLDLTPCQKIANSWILTEPTGPRSISNELLPMLGLNFPESYEFAGRWETAPGAGGFNFARTHELYRPKNPAQSLLSCNTERELPIIAPQ